MEVLLASVCAGIGAAVAGPLGALLGAFVGILLAPGVRALKREP